MQAAADARGIVAAVGFSPPDALAPLVEHLDWHGKFFSDQDRSLYRRLGLGRAPWWRVYSPGTLAIYTRALARGHRPAAPVEDPRQLGGDAVVRDGVAVRLWRPRSPDDRVAPDVVVEAAHGVSEDPR